MPKGKIRSAVDVAKERVGVAHFSRRLIGALSGGYRQRVGLAQAVLHEPSLVVLDEPTNGLDPVQIVEVRKLIKDIAEERTVLLSTHILSEVEALCDDIKMIEQGQIVFEGSIGDYANVVEPHDLTVRFDKPPREAELLTVAGVEGVEVVGPDRIDVHITPGADVSAALIKASVEHGWDLKELCFQRSTLEQVFARLSGSAARAAETEAA